MLEIAIGAIIVALIFDFVNGFNDSANSVATVIGTRVLKPLQAVSLSAAMNFIGPFIFGVAVATTIAKGIVSPDDITVYMIIGGLAGAISWSTLCTYFGLPISNSHSLVGGIMGAGIAGLGFEKLVYGGLTKVFAGIVIAPVGGIIFGFLLTGLIITIFANRRPAIVNRTFGMGIIVLILFSAGLIPELEMPLWVIFAAATAMGLGTFFGGYKVIKTLGVKVTKLKPYQGFAAETGGGLMLAIFAVFGIPASTTHAITGTIMGAGAARRTRAVRWSVGRQIVFAWIITIPGSALMAIGFTYLIHLFV
jgi:PiT family inorganic phosphate transporter